MGEGITAGGDTVDAAVVGTINSAVLCTGHGVGAERGIPRASGVAIGKAGGGVQPAPVGIEHDGGLLGSAATGGTLSPGEFGMGLGGQRTNLLGRGSGEEESEGEEGGRRHDERLGSWTWTASESGSCCLDWE